MDSVTSPSGAVSFTQKGEHLIIAHNATAGAILHWDIYYHGSTTKDGSGWGGIHHDGAYDYNLGVGFAANPQCTAEVSSLVLTILLRNAPSKK